MMSNKPIMIRGELRFNEWLLQWMYNNFGHCQDCVVVLRYGHTAIDLYTCNLICVWAGDSSTSPGSEDDYYEWPWDWYEGEDYIIVDKIFPIHDDPFEEPYLVNQKIYWDGVSRE